MIALAFDLETNGLLDTVDTLWCMGIADVSEPHSVQTYTDYDDDYPSIAEGVARLQAADRLVAHNGIGYDVPALLEITGDDLGYERQWDTMTVAGLLEPERRSLKLSVFGEMLGFPKGDYDDWEGGYTDEMRVYMERDVEITALLYIEQQRSLDTWAKGGNNMAQALRIEHGTQKVLSQQNRHGFRLDVEAAEELDCDLRGELSDIEVELQTQFPAAYAPDKAAWCYKTQQWTMVNTFTPKGNNSRSGYTAGAPLTKVKLKLFNPGSRAQIAQRLSQGFGWKPSKFTDAGTAVVDETMLQDLPFEPAQVMCRYLRLTKQIGQLSEGKNGWLKVQHAGRVHGYVRSCGARTHRMSHNSPNMAQVDKDSRMRALWVADEGHKLVGADASGLELRLMAAYLYQIDGGKYADSVLHGTTKEGTDVHTLNQKAVGLHSRNSAKTIFYAWLYGAGDGKLGQVVVQDALDAGQPKPKGNMFAIGKRARADLQRGIDGIDSMISYAQGKAKQAGYLTLPDGRPVKSAERTALNSLLQGAGAVLMKLAAVIFDQRLAPEQGLVGHFDYCANVHDEIQFSVEPEYADRVGQAFCDAIRLAGEELGYKIPFAGEYDVGDSWADTH